MSILEQQQSLARLITNLHFQNKPELEARYGEAGKEKCLQDSLYHLSFLAASLSTQLPAIFGNYLKWVQRMLASRNISAGVISDNLDYTAIACQQLLPASEYEEVIRYINYGKICIGEISDSPASFFRDDNPLQAEAQQYLKYLLEGHSSKARLLIESLSSQGQSIEHVFEHIFQASQYEIGRLWESNQATVAEEHYCSAATQMIISSFYSSLFQKEKPGPRVVSCTVSEDLHELGIRMLSDLFELNGWTSNYLGANMQDVQIISALKETSTDIFALSVTMAFNIPKAGQLIEKIRSDKALAGLKVMVGGYLFNQVPGLWKKIGADGTARGAREAISVANSLIFPH